MPTLLTLFRQIVECWDVDFSKDALMNRVYNELKAERFRQFLQDDYALFLYVLDNEHLLSAAMLRLCSLLNEREDDTVRRRKYRSRIKIFLAQLNQWVCLHQYVRLPKRDDSSSDCESDAYDSLSDNDEKSCDVGGGGGGDGRVCP